MAYVHGRPKTMVGITVLVASSLRRLFTSSHTAALFVLVVMSGPSSFGWGNNNNSNDNWVEGFSIVLLQRTHPRDRTINFRRRVGTCYGKSGVGTEDYNEYDYNDDGNDDDNDDDELHQKISREMKDTYLMDHHWTGNSSDKDGIGDPRNRSGHPRPTLHTALCLVPPDETWDAIQKARHMALDETLYTWPPAIRLFHPFAPRPYLASVAMALGELVEQRRLEPFEIVLDHLTIRPMRLRKTTTSSQPQSTWEADDNFVNDEVRQLIRNEEVQGFKRKERRLLQKEKMRQLQEEETQQEEPLPSSKDSEEEDSSKSKKKRGPYRKKKKVNEDDNESSFDRGFDYDGPCTIFLDPDKESRRRLVKLRALLQRKLFPSFGLVVEAEADAQHGNDEAAYGIRLGTFPSVAKALETAKNLQELLKKNGPMTFDATDMHLMSREEEKEDDHEKRKTRHVESSFSSSSASSHLSSPYECDAMVMLWGAEEEDGANDDDDSEYFHDLVSLLFSDAGEDGGGASELGPPSSWRKTSVRVLEDDSAKYSSSLEEGDNAEDDEEKEDFTWFDYLDDDEDDAWSGQGATIVIGRIQLFLGEMRSYVGMPAYNPMDFRERSSNTLGGSSPK